MTADVTGRDRRIIAKALVYAIQAIDALPERNRENSDQADMNRLLHAIVDSDVDLEIFIQGARRHLTAGNGSE
jgi:hypothetical protein